MNEPSGTSTASSASASHSGSAGGHSSGGVSSEADFLDQQARQAKAAVAAALADAKAALAEGVDPATWARRYPVMAIGSALVAGFATAVLTIPSRQQQELRRIEKIARALHPEASESKPKAEKKPAAEPAGASGSFWGTVLKEALAFARPLVAALVSSHFAPPPGDGQDGHEPAADAPPPQPAPVYPPRS